LKEDIHHENACDLELGKDGRIRTNPITQTMRAGTQLDKIVQVDEFESLT
jgi:hypothetical protein